MTNTDTTALSKQAGTSRRTRQDGRPRGQVLVLFALLLTFLLGTSAFVIDLAWIWVNELKVQRAADAAALAGVVHLPGSVGNANASALLESNKNGYRDATTPTPSAALQPALPVDVWARPDPTDPRRMLVQVSANIETFFMQLFGFDELRVSRDSRAEFILPVPMGSPENYYGVFGQIRTPDGGVWQANPAASVGPRGPAGVASSSTSNVTNNLPTAATQSNAGSCTTEATKVWAQTPAGVTADLDNRVLAADDLPSGQWIKSTVQHHRVCLGTFGFGAGAFNIPDPVAGPAGSPPNPGPAINGIEVRLKAFATDTTSCTINVDLMWGDQLLGGQVNQTGAAGNTQGGAGDKPVALNGTEGTAPNYRVLGGAADNWGRTWDDSEIETANFRVRLWNNDPAGCDTLTAGQPFNPLPNPPPAPTGFAPGGGEVYVDKLEVVVHYTTFTWIPDPVVVSPYNDTLNARGLWGTFINQGAEKVNGDAYLPRWNPRTNPQNAEYNPTQYYNYAIEMPAGATNGEVWVFDPAFCATDGGGQFGTGDRWFGGSTNATSAYYTLYNTFNTPFDLGDDLGGVVSQAHNIFVSQQKEDDSLFASGAGPLGSGAGTSCRNGDIAALNNGGFWHNRWYPMQPFVSGGLGEETPANAEQPFPLQAPGSVTPQLLNMTGGNTYRLHTRSTNPASAGAMDNANGHNSFAIWARAWCGGAPCAGAPQVYGLGAMEAFTPLRGGGSAQFYLAEIEPVHIGKTIEIRLWDPGDTGSLSADLRVLYPTGGTYVNADLDFAATNIVQGQTAPGAANCNGRTDDTVGPPGAFDPFITTNTGGSSQYNGCWLTIAIIIPDGSGGTPAYDGQAPSALDENWWKIQYDMGGASTDNAFDLTTWQVTLRGNPVHLVVP